jgi:hypothetical protein
MSIAEASLEVPPTPRRRHAAVAGLVGGPYPNLGSSVSRRPFLTTTPTADDPAPRSATASTPPSERTLVRLGTSEHVLPAGGPYPNLTTRR